VRSRGSSGALGHPRRGAHGRRGWPIQKASLSTSTGGVIRRPAARHGAGLSRYALDKNPLDAPLKPEAACLDRTPRSPRSGQLDGRLRGEHSRSGSYRSKLVFRRLWQSAPAGRTLGRAFCAQAQSVSWPARGPLPRPSQRQGGGAATPSGGIFASSQRLNQPDSNVCWIGHGRPDAGSVRTGQISSRGRAVLAWRLLAAIFPGQPPAGMDRVGGSSRFLEPDQLCL